MVFFRRYLRAGLGRARKSSPRLFVDGEPRGLTQKSKRTCARCGRGERRAEGENRFRPRLRRTSGRAGWDLTATSCHPPSTPPFENTGETARGCERRNAPAARQVKAPHPKKSLAAQRLKQRAMRAAARHLFSSSQPVCGRRTRAENCAHLLQHEQFFRRSGHARRRLAASSGEKYSARSTGRAALAKRASPITWQEEKTLVFQATKRASM